MFHAILQKNKLYRRSLIEIGFEKPKVLLGEGITHEVQCTQSNGTVLFV